MGIVIQQTELNKIEFLFFAFIPLVDVKIDDPELKSVADLDIVLDYEIQCADL